MSTFRYDMSTFPGRLLAPQPSVATIYLAGSVVLAVAAVVLGVVWKLSPYLLLLLAAMFWPYAIQLACLQMGLGIDEALGAATLGGAKALRRNDIGHLGVSACADLVVLASDHEADVVAHLGSNAITTTVVAGRIAG